MPRKFRAASAVEAVKGFKAVEALKAAEPSAVSSLRGYVGPADWGSIAYLSMCERTGSAIRLQILEPGALLESDGSIWFQGAGYGPYPLQRGLGAEFETRSFSSVYACTVRLSRPPNFAGEWEFAVDQTVLGRSGIPGGSPSNLTFVVRLGPGSHTFWVRPFSVSFVFYSLTVFAVPERAPD